MTDHTRRAVDNGTLARLDTSPVLSLSFKIMGGLVFFVVAVLAWNAKGIIAAQERLAETQVRTIEAVSVLVRDQAVVAQRLGEHDRRIDNVERRVWPGGSAFTTP